MLIRNVCYYKIDISSNKKNINLLFKKFSIDNSFNNFLKCIRKKALKVALTHLIQASTLDQLF